jgi:hypothetical protein
LEDLVHGRLHALAERALEVREDLHRDLRLLAALERAVGSGCVDRLPLGRRGLLAA